MRRTVSISGPLARGGAVLILCTLAACIERRADGRRGSDTISAAEAPQKRDTGFPAARPGSVSAGAVAGTDLTIGTPEQPFTSPRADAPTVPTAPAAPTGSTVAAPQVQQTPQAPSPGTAGSVTQSDIMALAQRHPIVPISGIAADKLPDTFNELRGGTRKHEALDILAPRGTPVHSADEGTAIKLFTSKAGGLTVYVAGPAQRFVYYYAHLDSYASGLAEGQILHKGDVLGYVGSSGNADPNVPHLHFAIARTDNIRDWWKGEPINPTTVLQAAAQR